MMMLLSSWFTLPDASTMIASSTAYSTDIFSSLSFVLGVAVGVPVAIIALKWLIGLIRRNVSRLFKGGRRGRRGRR